MINSFGFTGTIKYEITAEDLGKVMAEVIIKTTNALIAKFENERLPEYVTRKEAMMRLNVRTANTMNSWEEKGYLKPHRIGGRIFYRQDELNEAYERVTRIYKSEIFRAAFKCYHLTG